MIFMPSNLDAMVYYAMLCYGSVCVSVSVCVCMQVVVYLALTVTIKNFKMHYTANDKIYK